MAREHIITARVDEEELATIEERMAEYGYDQRGRYLRDVAVGRIQDEYGSSTPSEYERLRDRIQVLEEAVFDANTTEYDAGEDGPPMPIDSGGNEGPGSVDAEPTNGVTGRTALREDDAVDDSEKQQPASEVDLEALTFDRDLTPQRREHLGAWLRHVREQGEGVTKSDFEAWWSDEREQETGYGARSFWEAFAKAAMNQSDHFDKPNSRTYRWIGEDSPGSSSGGVYDPTEEF